MRGGFRRLQLLVSNFVGPQLTDMLSSLAAMLSLIVLLVFWKPKDSFQLRGGGSEPTVVRAIPQPNWFSAWTPYVLLVVLVLLWGMGADCGPRSNAATVVFPWPGLHNAIARVPPAAPAPVPYPAIFKFNWLSAPGTACLAASILSAMVLRMSPARFGKMVLAQTGKQLLLPELTIATVLALAFLMNYSRRHRHAGLGVRGHRRAVPVLQRDARVAGRVPHRLRHVRQRLVRQPSGGNRRAASA